MLISNSGKKPDEEGCAADECVTHATCNTKSNPTKCQCDTGYTATPTTKPTMCKFKLNCNKLEMNGLNCQCHRHNCHFICVSITCYLFLTSRFQE